MRMHTRLERSTTNKVIGGVCGGIAEYLQLDATLVRVFFVVSIFLTAGIAILGYIVLLLLMPLPGQPQPFVSSSPASAGDPSSPAATMQPVVTDPEATERRRAAFGYFLIAIGVAFLLANVGAFRIVRWDLVWPVVVVGAGVLLLAQRIRP